MIGAEIAVPDGPGFVVRRQSLRPGAGGELSELLAERAEALGVRVADDRHDEPLVIEVDGDSEMHAVVDDELAIPDRRVHVWEGGDTVDDRAGDEREVGEPGDAAHSVDALEVDLHRDERVRSDVDGTEHVLAREPLHPVERDDLVLRRCLEEADDVLARDTARGSGAVDRDRLELMLGDQPPHHR